MSTPTDQRPPTGDLEHAPDCTDPRVVRQETPRRHLLICTQCGGYLAVARRNEWRDDQ